ncbi:MAG: hypothetical protein ACRD1R_02345 [Acidobacteriota bacterium]
MCDYSLEGYQNRKAVEGEALISRRFHTGTQGFTAPDSPHRAVCVTEGTKLLVRDIPDELQKTLSVGPEAMATFTYLERSPSRWWSWAFLSPVRYHRDGLVFSSGKEILINNLPEGLRADVLSQAVAAEPVVRPEGIESNSPSFPGRDGASLPTATHRLRR